MKKIFALALVLVSMSAAMTSCDKDNDMTNELDPANRPALSLQAESNTSKPKKVSKSRHDNTKPLSQGRQSFVEFNGKK